MDEVNFPPNSKLVPLAPAKKEIKKVVTGEVSKRKPSIGKRFKEMFISTDGKTAWRFVLEDVVVPAAKDMIADAGREGIERVLFGQARGRNPRVGQGGRGRMDYGAVFQGSRQDPRRQLSNAARATHNFDELELGSRADAQDVLDGMFDLLAQFDEVCVGDLYELVGFTRSPVDDQWGWTSLGGANTNRTRSGTYVLNLPKPIPLD